MWENTLILLSKKPPTSLVAFMTNSRANGIVGAKSLSKFRGSKYKGFENITIEADHGLDEAAAAAAAGRALQYVGKFVRYDLARRNCEHFARWCFDKNGRCKQLEKVSDAVVGSSAAVVGGATASVVAAPAAATGFVASATSLIAPYSAGLVAPLATPAAPLYAVGLAAIGTAVAAAYGAHTAYRYLAYADDTFPVVEVPDLPRKQKHEYKFDDDDDDGAAAKIATKWLKAYAKVQSVAWMSSGSPQYTARRVILCESTI
jgi:hypothetical protein